jgi:tetratricopeptide (TPR) repeat protein
VSMRWFTVYLFLCVVIQPSISFCDDFSDSQLNRGIKNSDTYSYVLMEKAQEDRSHAVELLKTALLYSPDLPAVYFELSEAVFSFSGDGILNSIDYIIRGINAYSRNFWWSFTLMGCLVFSGIISLVCAFALIVMVRLFIDIPLVSHDVEETYSRGLIVVVIMAFSLASPLLFLGGTLILLGLYMKKYDRSIVYLFLVFLAFYPVFSKMATTYVRISSSGVVKAIVKVNEGKDNDYAISLLKDSKDYASLYSYALALKRNGRYEEAIAVYRRLLENKRDARVYVNLGNCYIGLYNFEEGKRSILQQATESYTAAINLKPLPSAYYNISQVSREMFDFTAGEQYFKSALAADRVAVSGYRAIAGRNVNRFVIDETLGPSEIWNFVFKRFYTSSSSVLSAVPPSAISLAAGILFVIFYLLDTLWHQHSFRCRKCGTILCLKCEKGIMWGEMCPQCFGSLVKLEELDVKERVAWLLGIYEHQRRHRDTMKVLSFTFPGLSHVYAGRILVGFLFLWPFLFFLLLYVTLRTFVPDSHLISHGFFKWATLWISIGLYLLSHYFTKKRIAQGWL